MGRRSSGRAVCRHDQDLVRTVRAQALTVGGRFETLLQFANAETSYAQAKASAANAIEADYADFLRARVQVKCDCGDAARPVYERLLNSETIDDEGVPLALYAARQLIDLHVARAPLLAVMERAVAARRWASPAAIHLEKALVDALAADPVDPAVQVRAAKLLSSIEFRLADEELALKLQRESSASLGAALTAKSGGESVWQPIDQAQWFLNVSTSAPGMPPVVIAVRVGVDMTRKEFGLLRLLASRAGEVVTREQLLDEVWGYDATPTTRTVDNHVASLRSKIEPDPAQPRHLVTVFGVGYKWVE